VSVAGFDGARLEPIDRIMLFLTQLLPSTTHPYLRSQLRQLVYQALVD
jgi:hypothetical protein